LTISSGLKKEFKRLRMISAVLKLVTKRCYEGAGFFFSLTNMAIFVRQKNKPGSLIRVD